MPLDFVLLSMTELRTRPGEILDRVADGGEMFLVERGGRRRACLVPLSFFFPDVSPTRIADEMNDLADNHEEPRTSIKETRELALVFPHKLGDGSTIDIEIVLPHGYPNTCPRVYANAIGDAPPHRWQDGALCLYGVLSGWNPGKHNIVSTLTLARRWLSHYDAWRKSGQWPKEEAAFHD